MYFHFILKSHEAYIYSGILLPEGLQIRENNS